MCGLFSAGKTQYAPRMAVSSSQGAVNVQPHPEKRWAQTVDVCARVLAPLPAYLMSPFVRWTPAGR